MTESESVALPLGDAAISSKKIIVAIVTRIFLSKPTGLVYHQLALRVVYHHALGRVYHQPSLGLYENPPAGVHLLSA